MPSTAPLSYEEEAARAGVVSRVPLGVRPIRVRRIVGSAGKAKKIRADFLPRASGPAGGNYRAILRKMQDGETLPPITVFQLGNRYFVVDGHTRVAAALALHIEFLDAQVIEALPRKEGETNLTHYARREFERYTDLEGVRLTAPWRYHLLHHHLEGYQLYLERSRGREVSLPEAARIWHRSQYLPTLMEIRRRKLSSSNGGHTTGDIYTDILKAWSEQEGPPGSLREMLDSYDQSLKQSRATWAKRLAASMVDAALPKAIAPIGLPDPAQLATMDVEAELAGLQTDHREDTDPVTEVSTDPNPSDAVISDGDSSPSR